MCDPRSGRILSVSLSTGYPASSANVGTNRSKAWASKPFFGAGSGGNAHPPVGGCFSNFNACRGRHAASGALREHGDRPISVGSRPTLQ